MCVGSDRTFSTKELTPGEFYDRFTILIRKAKFDPENYKARVDDFVGILNENGKNGVLMRLVCELQMANTDIWNLESAIRQGMEGELGLKEVGERALKIRVINSCRVKLVNEINEFFGINDRKESKFEHASE